MTALALATTQPARPATFRGAPIEDPPAHVEAAARRWLLASKLSHAAFDRYKVRSAITPWDRRTASDHEAVERAWAAHLEAEERMKDARWELAKAVAGPRRVLYAYRDHIIGWDKPIGRTGFGGHELLLMRPDHPRNPLTNQRS